MTEIDSNNFVNLVLKGLKWGSIMGGVLWIFIVISGDSSDLGFWGFTFDLIVFGIGGSVLGALSVGIFQGVIGFLTFIGTTLLSLVTITATSTVSTFIGTATISTIIGWVSVAILPVLLIVKSFIHENAPEWIKKSINNAIIAFLTSLIFTVLTYLFQNSTGIKLLNLS